MGSCLPTNYENCESILRQACAEFIEGLRANGRKPVFGTKVAQAIQRGIGRL